MGKQSSLLQYLEFYRIDTRMETHQFGTAFKATSRYHLGLRLEVRSFQVKRFFDEFCLESDKINLFVTSLARNRKVYDALDLKAVYPDKTNPNKLSVEVVNAVMLLLFILLNYDQKIKQVSIKAHRSKSKTLFFCLCLALKYKLENRQKKIRFAI